MAKTTTKTKTEQAPAEAKAKTTKAKAAPKTKVPSFAKDKPTVNLADLQTARVIVQDNNGNFFYLDQGPRPGDYILRVVPHDPANDEQS